jgi:SAM-dependent methyltransferase
MENFSCILFLSRFGNFVPFVMRYILLLTATCLLLGCSSSEAPETTPTIEVTTSPTASTSVPPPSTSERDSWQKPQEVFMLMGNDLRGKLIADLAAGDGYFTFKMIEVGANVIAISDDQRELDAIEARKKEMKLGDDRLRTRLSPKGDPGLAPEEVDACLLVHSYVSIPDKKAYLTKVFEGTRHPRALFILEWLNSETPIGPPMTDRISSERIMDDIGTAGYTDVGAYSAKIPHQTFLFASYQTDLPEDLTPEQMMQLQQGQ